MTKPKRPKAKCLDPAFVYTPSHSTNIAKRFEKIWREQRKEAEQQRASVVQIKRAVKSQGN